MKNKNKVRQTRAAQMDSRAVQRGARKSTGLSNDAAKGEGEVRIAERLHDMQERLTYRVASLAAQINPRLMEKNPTAAINLAWKRFGDTGRILSKMVSDTWQETKAEEARAQAEAEQAWVDNFRAEYQHGVKLITGEKNWDRALKKFKRFITAKKLTDSSSLEEKLEKYRKHVFKGPELAAEVRDFTEWWKQEKSGQARKSALGRVKRKKSDLRFTENRRHKRGYCKKCGKRVRPGERLCDVCVSGKPLLINVGDKKT
jgi:hypothetical protein